MRPEKLTLTAFGSYAGQQVLDFAELDPHRLFLIFGRTGAGKTTLLDALCFALFGESSGEERTAPMLRAEIADTALATEVTLDFALGPARYRITRQPEQPRARRRSETARNRPASATLWLLSDGGPHVVADKVRDVDAQVARLLGYSAAEFRQVVLLPQGRFREFLSASARDRQEILRTLFRTTLFAAVKAALKQAAKQAQAEAEQAAAIGSEAMAQAGADTLDAAEAQLATLRAAAAEATAASEAGRARAAAARDALEQGRSHDARLRRLALATTALENLEAARHEAEARDQRIARARTAMMIAAAEPERTRETTAAEAARAADAAAASATRQAEAGAMEAIAAKKLGDLTARQTALEVARADAVTAKAIAEQSARMAKATASQRQAERQAHAAQKTVATAEVAHRAAARACEATRTAAAGLEAARLRHGQATLRLTQRTEHEQAAAEATLTLARLETCREEKKSADEAAAMADARLNTAEQAWRAGQAALLAETLAEGEPCPVCGARHHPAPARHADSETQAMLDEARRQVARARQQAEKAGNALAGAEADAANKTGHLRTSHERLGDGASIPIAQLEAEAAAALEVVRGTEAAAQQLDQAMHDLTRAEAALAAARANETRLREALAAADALLHEARAGGVATDEAEARQVQQDAEANAVRLDADLTHDRSAFDKATAARHSTDEASRRESTEAAARHLLADGAAAAADAALRQHFADRADFEAALMPQHALRQEEAAAGQYRTQRAAAEAEHQTARGEAEGLARPDLPALQAASDALDGEAQQATAAAGRARQQADDHAGRVLRLGTALARAAEAEAAFSLARHMADTADGRDDDKLDFEGWVLSTLLDEALAAANARLARMLGGRFSIRRRDGAGDGREAAGLGLEIFDDNTGAWGSPARLSGGEGFCTSLALALGLADVVQRRTGGVRIDALFVDEGFGTLDDETLDTAMGVLGALDEGSRLIGVISHVSELRNRIAAKVEVTRDMQGSRARIVLG